MKAQLVSAVYGMWRPPDNPTSKRSKKSARRIAAKAANRAKGKDKARIDQIVNLWRNCGFDYPIIEKALAEATALKSHRDAPSYEQKQTLAKTMRLNPTPAEEALGAALFYNFPGEFETQVLIYGWIADFYSKKHSMVLEADGSVHNSKEQQEKDATRNRVMRERGLTVLRFTNIRILNDINGVVEEISRAISLGSRPRTEGPNSTADRRKRESVKPSGHGQEVAVTETPVAAGRD